jgi:TPP-dependent pyruvate/acetoin dehydrogenase alpha subunit
LVYNKIVDRASPLNLYRQMLLIRRFEERSAEMYALAKIGGFCHLSPLFGTNEWMWVAE